MNLISEIHSMEVPSIHDYAAQMDRISGYIWQPTIEDENYRLDTRITDDAKNPRLLRAHARFVNFINNNSLSDSVECHYSIQAGHAGIHLSIKAKNLDAFCEVLATIRSKVIDFRDIMATAMLEASPLCIMQIVIGRTKGSFDHLRAEISSHHPSAIDRLVALRAIACDFPTMEKFITYLMEQGVQQVGHPHEMKYGRKMAHELDLIAKAIPALERNIKEQDAMTPKPVKTGYPAARGKGYAFPHS